MAFYNCGVVGRISTLVLCASILTSCNAVKKQTFGKSETCKSGVEVSSIDGTRLFADCSGYESEQTFLFIHGWSQSKDVWDMQVNILSSNYQVISYDLRGHGKSDRPQNDDAFGGRWIHAQDIEKILSEFKVEGCVIPVGWSFGAIIAADAAVYLGSRVCGLVLVSGPPDAATVKSRSFFGPLLPKLSGMTAGPRDDKEKRDVISFLKESYVSGSWPKDMYEVAYEATMSLSPEERRRVVKRPSYSNVEGLNNSAVPVLFVHGDQDSALKAKSSISYSSELDNAQLKIYEGVGHWPFIEAADRFNRDLVEFANSLGN